MPSTANQIWKGWKKILFFLIAYLILIFLFHKLSDSITSVLFKEKVELNSFTVSILLNALFSIALVWMFKKGVDKESFRSLGFIWKGFGKERSIGFITGIFLITFISTILWLIHLLNWYTSDVLPQEFLILFLILILIAISEEVVFRGYLLSTMMNIMPRQAALILSAIIFAIFHSLNPNFNFIAFINIFLAGLLLGVNYIYTRNLGFSIFFHFSWNFFQGPVFGFPVSGIELPALLVQYNKGSVILTGGNFGLEASWLLTLIVSIAFILLYFIFQRKYNSVSVE